MYACLCLCLNERLRVLAKRVSLVWGRPKPYLALTLMACGDLVSESYL